MPAEAASLPPIDEATTARERIRIGALPAWAERFPVGYAFKAAQPGSLTYLLLSRQVHAETNESCFQTAVRLEDMQAVQHQSQWRLEFEPRSQSVILHWVRIRRGDIEIEQAHAEKLRVLQREEGLDRFIIDGWFTLLLVLEDVRPGDVIESCYTFQTKPWLLPEVCATFFVLPEAMSVGRFQFSVRCNSARAIKWKSSGHDIKPVESSDNGLTLWQWTGENHSGGKPEPDTPPGYIGSPWMQFSDCPDWCSVAAAFAAAWNAVEDDQILAETAKQIAEKETELLPRIERAIQFVQDEHRYLSVVVELGGNTPSPPGRVTRRRYGDCKDLSFLLVHLLRRLGASARPVLVNTSLRRSLGDMLPMPGLFNHVVVEFEAEGQTRWVDATSKAQGGGPLNRVIPDFGAGLPVDANARDLIPTPPGSVQPGRYELKESILLDTAGGPSLIAVSLRTKGHQAEWLRHQFQTRELADIDKERVQACANRFRWAKRAGPLQHRDDRATNEFVLAEVFDINGFLVAQPQQGTCGFAFPENMITNALGGLERTKRRNPLALIFPCEIVHIIEIESPALQQIPVDRRRIRSSFFEYSRSRKSVRGYWSTTLTLSTLADSIPAERLAEYRKSLEEVWQDSSRQFMVPLGYARPRKRGAFGELPAVSTKPVQSPIQPGVQVRSVPAAIQQPLPGVASPVPVPTMSAETIARPAVAADAEPARPAPQRRVPRRQGHSHSSVGRHSRVHFRWLLWLIIAFVLFLIRIFYSMGGGRSH